MHPALARVQRTLLSLPRWVKQLLVLCNDIFLCGLTVWMAYCLRLGQWVVPDGSFWLLCLISIILTLPVFIRIGLYRAIFRYNGWPALMALTQAVTIYGLGFVGVVALWGIDGVPRTVGLIQPILMLCCAGGVRALVRLWLGKNRVQGRRKISVIRTLIYGAGNTGQQLVQAMQHSTHMQVLGFLDDDSRLQGHHINGLPIYSPNELPRLQVSRNIKTVLLAMPHIARQRRNEILRSLRGTGVSVRLLPNMGELAQGKISLADFQELDIDDLLGREPVTPDQNLLISRIYGKTVLVTGAGGSIGSEISRQIAAIGPATLLLVEQGEFALYQIHQELQARVRGRQTAIVPLLASVQDGERMRDIMATWRPQTVYHAAAYKHVPLVEHNPAEGIRNNVFGTWYTAQAALENGVHDFVLISTDKAVRPTNIMGASKRLAEMVLQALAAEHSGQRTVFSMVRFGNVLGSSGSVVPLFRQQIRDGGPITLTHEEVTRYFMTIPEASQLVIQAGAMARGGDVFVLDMGEPVRIVDLARRMVELSGLTLRDENNPEGDIEIQVTGLRPGEKLYEELLIAGAPLPTDHPRIMKAREEFLPWSQLENRLHQIQQAMQENDLPAVRTLLLELVSGYQPEATIVDWVYARQQASLHRTVPPASTHTRHNQK